jgi:hypothetical protein
MAVVVLPHVEKLVVDWALTVDDLTDQFDGRIYTMLPKDPVWPAARLNRIGGGPVGRAPHWLDQALIQVDVWGGPKSTTRLAAATFQAHLAQSLVGTHDLGTVTAVEVGGLTWLPDDTYAPAKPRYSFDVSVTLHP